jgi:hypothetical protein
MDLRVTQHQTPDGTKRVLRLRNINGGKDIDIFFDLLGTTAPPPSILDGFLFGIIFYAMRLGEDIRVEGSVSFQGLANLNEFQEAWSLWKPHLYKKIRVLPDNIVESACPQGSKNAIAAFSGGVDSIFTALRHSTKLLGSASYPLDDAVLMVHGFDVPLSAPEQFAALQERTEPLLDELNLNLLTIKTNSKEVNIQDWEDSHMAQLACCLHQYSYRFCYALAGSTDPYDALFLPWGSNPATDHLLSSDAMRLIHDGAGYSRTKKIALIATHKTAMQVVKVCWEGKDTSKNCGHCEECIRAQLNFLAVGVARPPCFEKPIDLDEISHFRLQDNTYLGVVSTYNYAREHGITDEWVSILKTRIERYRHPPGKIRKLLDLIRRGEFFEIVAKMKAHLASR